MRVNAKDMLMEPEPLKYNSKKYMDKCIGVSQVQGTGTALKI